MDIKQHKNNAKLLAFLREWSPEIYLRLWFHHHSSLFGYCYVAGLENNYYSSLISRYIYIHSIQSIGRKELLFSHMAILSFRSLSYWKILLKVSMICTSQFIIFLLNSLNSFSSTILGLYNACMFFVAPLWR